MAPSVPVNPIVTLPVICVSVRYVAMFSMAQHRLGASEPYAETKLERFSSECGRISAVVEVSETFLGGEGAEELADTVPKSLGRTFGRGA